MNITLNVSKVGAIPATPEELRTKLIADVTAKVPNYTAGLPGSLIENLSSTVIYAIAAMNMAQVASINNISPATQNDFVLGQFGRAIGFVRGEVNFATVQVTFTGTPFLMLAKGLLVSDDIHQYQVTNATLIPSSGSVTVNCRATVKGVWAIPANSVTKVLTPPPSPSVLTCVNLINGVAGSGEESISDFRARVTGALLSPINSSVNMLRGKLSQLPDVSARLISLRQVGTGFKLVVGGGNPADVANVVFNAGYSYQLVKSTTLARNVSVNIIDGGDTYNVTYVSPVNSQLVIDIKWGTVDALNVSTLDIAQKLKTATYNYIMGIIVGLPINLQKLATLQVEALEGTIPPEQVRILSSKFFLNGSEILPEPGTFIIVSDPESYFSTSEAAIAVTRV